MKTDLEFFLLILCSLLIISFVVLLLKHIKLLIQQASQLKSVREKAIEQSKTVLRGKMVEHLIPYFPSFKFNPCDTRFMGSPIDLIVFDGLSEGSLKQIVFLEIKTGKKPNLSLREKQIRDCLLNKNIAYEMICLDR